MTTPIATPDQLPHQPNSRHPSHPFFPRLVVFTGQVEHFRDGSSFVAHAGFVKEMEIWSQFFDQLLIICPDGVGLPKKGDEIPYSCDNVSFVTLSSQIRVPRKGVQRVLALRHHVMALGKCLRLIRGDDVVMSRGPDGVGMLGVLLARLRRVRHMGKYAAQWKGRPGESLSYRIQKWVYRQAWLCRGPVQIYGSPDPRRRHLIPFFTSSVTHDRYRELAPLVQRRAERKPALRRVSFVGRLYQNKGVDTILRAMAEYESQGGVAFQFDVVGDGPYEQELRALTAELKLQERTVFHGWKSSHDIEDIYHETDLVVFASRAEGFGKVLVEAMAYGVPVIASDAGMNEQILGPGYPYLFAPEDVSQLSQHFAAFANEPEQLRVVGQMLRQRLQKQRYFLDEMRATYARFLQELDTHGGFPRASLPE